MQAWQKNKSVVGMIHLLPLAGSPLFSGDFKQIRAAAVQDAQLLHDGGVHALMMENFGDVPFFPGRVPTHVAAQMTAIAFEIRERFNLPLGINVLRNDGQTAIAVAHAAGADFIRVNVLCGARVADQGVLQGIAHDLLRDRKMLGADRIEIFADVDVKHSAPLAARHIADEVDDTIERGLASALVVSGAGTGKPTDLEKVKSVKAAAGGTPVFIGSGITAMTIENYLPFADGFIVGTAFKKDGVPTNAIEPARITELLNRIK